MDSFSIKKFFETSHDQHTTTVEFGGVRFQIRRINGYERLKFSDITSATDRVVFVLGRGLIDSETNRPIGDNNARRLLESNEAVANRLTNEILEFSNRVLKQEQEQWGTEEKNSIKTGSTSSSTEDTASATASTPSPRKSRKRS